MSDHVQRNHQDVRLRSRRSYRPARLLLLLAVALPSACGLFLESYHLDDTRLKNATCLEGDLRCTGDWVVSCAHSLQEWVDNRACDLPNRCDSSGTGSCKACAKGEYRCDGASLQLCNSDRSGWDTIETCSNSNLCHVNLQACAPCASMPTEYQCNGGVLSQCTAQGTWGAPTQCGAPELCSVAADRLSGECKVSAQCKPLAYSCKDALLERCDAQGVVRLGMETCASPTLCQQTLSAGAGNPNLLSCVRPSCDANQARCDGNQLLVCSPERTGFAPGRVCSAENPCNPKLRDCGRCSPGEVFCSGPDLLKCDPSGVFQLVQTCDSSALCNVAAAQCDPPRCEKPGTVTCDASEPLLSVCGDDLVPHVTQCGTVELCNARDARCEVPACEEGAVRCDRQQLQHCNAAHTAWETDLTCQSGSYCDPASKTCVAGACQGTGFRCNDVFLERCTPTGFQRVARCAVPSLCHASMGLCDPPQCVPGTFDCMGQYLKKCGDDRQWHDIRTCDGECDKIGGTCL